MINLQKQIENLNEDLFQQLPSVITTAFADSIADLKNSGLENNCVKVGAKIKPFNLTATDGKTVSSEDLFKGSEKLILAFFRGIWCPYCNLEMKALQDWLPEITKNGVRLLGISPQQKEYNQTMKNDHQIQFDLFQDENNALAKSLGISFSLQDFVVPYYQSLGIDLAMYNNNSENELSVPAIFVVDKSYQITYSFVDTNYMNRVDIDTLIKNL